MESSDEDLIDLLKVVLVPGIGPRLSTLLFQRFGSATAILNASFEDHCSVEGIGGKLSGAITAARSKDDARLELEECRKLGVSVVTRAEARYPKSLLEIPDPPAVLFSRGTIEPRDQLAIAIVGSRQCTLYGKQTAERLAAGLARAGFTIVSGLARGIDGAAHRGALSAGGRTIAVCATGLKTIYPPEHASLADEIVASGAVISESPLGREPRPGLFPQRNRIISGLSQAVIIVEAGRRSGALHTARHAMEQGRDVFAVPGRIDSLPSQGCHDLIRDGVPLIRGVDDVLEALGPLTQPVERAPGETVQSPRELLLNDVERVVLNRITHDPEHIDSLLPLDGLETPQLLATLTVLEMKRLIRRLPGGYVARTPY